MWKSGGIAVELNVHLLLPDANKEHKIYALLSYFVTHPHTNRRKVCDAGAILETTKNP
jgi:hypothetical protein